MTIIISIVVVILIRALERCSHNEEKQENNEKVGRNNNKVIHRGKKTFTMIEIL